MLKAPEHIVRRLQSAIGERTLTIEYDPAASNDQGHQVWDVFYMQHGQPTWVCDWPDTIDGGNIEGLIRKVAKYDYARQKGVKAYALMLDRKMEKIRQDRANRRMDAWRGLADYSRRAFQAWRDGKPNCGAT